MSAYMRVHTDSGRVVDVLPDGSQVTPEEDPGVILEVAVDRLRRLNSVKATSSREVSLAITHAQEAQHWLRSLKDRKGSY